MLYSRAILRTSGDNGPPSSCPSPCGEDAGGGGAEPCGSTGYGPADAACGCGGGGEAGRAACAGGAAPPAACAGGADVRLSCAAADGPTPTLGGVVVTEGPRSAAGGA